jgi:hypothetical protein
MSLGELELAWARTKADIGERGFVTIPHLSDWVEVDRTRWLRDLEASIGAGYQPDFSLPCLTPKPGWMVRPGAVLRLNDEILYNFLVGRMLKGIWDEVRWSQGDPDIAYRLTEQGLSRSKWLERGTAAYRRFRKLSLERLSGEVSHVVTTDVTGFYENIDIRRMEGDLRRCRAKNDDLALLVQCLNKWAHPRLKGIPQGHSASDILAKLYFSQIDRALKNEGHSHLRYVDDLRVFCRSKREAKAVIQRLTELMSQSGLNLQSAKTRILARSDAEAEFKGVAGVIEGVEQRLIVDMAIQAHDDPYEFINEYFTKLRQTPGPGQAVLEKAFAEYFPLTGGNKFDKSLFHYLLGRLGIVGSTIAVDYCVATLRHRPEETRDILSYLAKVDLTEEQIGGIVEYMASEDAMYDYQLYQLLQWFNGRESIEAGVLGLSRRWVADLNRAKWLRVQAMAYIGKHGDSADLERVEASYGKAADDVERASTIEALHRVEAGKRNAFYGRVEGDAELVRRAILRVKGDALNKQVGRATARR